MLKTTYSRPAQNNPILDSQQKQKLNLLLYLQLGKLKGTSSSVPYANILFRQTINITMVVLFRMLHTMSLLGRTHDPSRS